MEKKHAPSARRLERAKREQGALRSASALATIRLIFLGGLCVAGWHGIALPLWQRWWWWALQDRDTWYQAMKLVIAGGPVLVALGLLLIGQLLGMIDALYVGKSLGIFRKFTADQLLSAPWHGAGKRLAAILWVYLIRLPLLALFVCVTISFFCIPLPTAKTGFGGSCLMLLSLGIAVTVVVSVLQTTLEYYFWKRSLRMSDQEVKEEYKETEGDPVHRGARKAIAYELSLEERVKCSSCIVVDHR